MAHATAFLKLRQLTIKTHCLYIQGVARFLFSARHVVMARLLSIWASAMLCSACVAESPNHDWQSMSRRIDQLISERCDREGVRPAELADDSEFLRRVHLDLTGVVPSVAETREFLNDLSANKRAETIERLLQSPAHVTHLANTWRNIMLPANLSPEQFDNSTGLHAWLRRQFANNMRYDRTVSDLVAATSGVDDGPALFFTALNLEPKKLAADTARIFLGLQMQCAECHDHPYDRWTQEDFWGYAAFFARLPQTENRGPLFRLADSDRGEVTLPDTQRVVLPRYPGGEQASEPSFGTRRRQLSIWLAAPDNPYLARAAVNRVWAMLLGRGLVQPVDDLGPHNPASHPELLEELSDYFVDSGYDLRNLLRTVANTQAYQRTSCITEDAPPPELFAVAAVKVLTAEQLFDSLSRCLSTADPGSPTPVVRGLNPRRQAFIARMQARSRDATEYNAGLQQALNMMNGGEMSEATHLQRSVLLASLEAPFFTDRQRIETIFLATLSRYPTPEELARVEEYMAQVAADRSGAFASQLPLFPLLSTFVDFTLGAAPKLVDQQFSAERVKAQVALSDVLWAVLNSAEFTLNH